MWRVSSDIVGVGDFEDNLAHTLEIMRCIVILQGTDQMTSGVEYLEFIKFGCFIRFKLSTVKYKSDFLLHESMLMSSAS